MTDLMTDEDLLRVCAARIRAETTRDADARLLDVREGHALRLFGERMRASSHPIASALLREPVASWEETILAHRCHRHPWYDTLANEVSVREYAQFFLENWAFPSFLQMVERTADVQITDAGRAAIQRNIDDERDPVPHADLMRRLIQALKTRAGEGLVLESYPSLVDRTLVFYYGYYCDPWHLVGCLFAMEAMALYRMAQMKCGLDRLGFDTEEIEFVRIHLHCDEHHAQDWRDSVILSSLAKAPQLTASITAGIADFLETSARYLDVLEGRARGRRRVAEPRSEALL